MCHMTDRPNPERDASSSPVNALIELVAAIAAAANERALLAAVMGHLQRWRPDAARLRHVVGRAEERPSSAPLAAAWSSGHALSDMSEETYFALVAGWGAVLDAPRLVADVAADAAEDPVLAAAAAAAGVRAVAVLPLHNVRHGGWQGLLTLTWTAPHAFTAEERDVYRLVMSAVAVQLGGLRTSEALRASLAEREQLQDVTRRLNVASTLEDRLRVLTELAPAADEAEVVLCTFESDPDGQPTWLTVLRVLPAGDRPLMSEVGARYYLPDIPFARLYLSSPDAPLLIGDIASDPRVDDYSRSLYARNGVRSTILMALTLQGRWVGLLNFSWLRPLEFGERERWMYQALAKQVALLLDSSLMVDRLRASLRETQQKERVMRTILDHIPTGVIFLEAPSGRPILTNPAAARLLGREIDAETTSAMAPRMYSIVFPDSDTPIPPDQIVGLAALTRGELEAGEVDVLPPGGDRRHLALNAVPMIGEGRVVENVILVLNDMTARKRADHERARLQGEVIRVQAAALAERSSPLIPITDDILVLPIIGSIDVERGQQVLETVLQGTSQRRTRVAIIDITGVPSVDTQAGAALTSAAQALRLLGVEPVLSGIRPEVAQMLIGLGVRLDGITTCGTLQSAIQFALRRLGRPSIG